jgi:tRNA(fMet)-specific endonuclease VapC
LDTDVTSYIIKDLPFANAFRPVILGKRVAVSFMTIAEIHEGVFRSNWGEHKKQKLVNSLRQFVVLPFTIGVCEIWGRIRAERKQQPISVGDAWIAATAIAYELPLLTNNLKHFQDITSLNLLRVP